MFKLRTCCTWRLGETLVHFSVKYIVGKDTFLTLLVQKEPGKKTTNERKTSNEIVSSKNKFLAQLVYADKENILLKQKQYKLKVVRECGRSLGAPDPAHVPRLLGLGTEDRGGAEQVDTFVYALISSGLDPPSTRSHISPYVPLKLK